MRNLPISSRVQWAAGILLGVGFAIACSTKSDSKKANSGTSTTPGASDTGSADGTGTGAAANPCLRFALQTATGTDSSTDTSGADPADTSTDTSADGAGTDSVGGSADTGSCGTPGGSTTAGDPTTQQTGTSTDPTTNPGTGGGTWSPGPGLEACVAQGKVWKAVVSGGPGACGDALETEFCCDEPTVLAQFPNSASALQAKFDPIQSAGLKLYGCSKNGGQYTFHWAAYANNSITYKTVYITSTPKGGASTAACTQVTSADLGITNNDGSDTSVSTGTATGTVPAMLGNVPTETTALKTYLATSAEYPAWSHDAAVILPAVATEHQYSRSFFNPTLATAYAGTTPFPVGSVVIKRLYTAADGLVVKGWVAKLKVLPGTTDDTWIFFDNIDQNTSPNAGRGLGSCVTAGCHTSTNGKDHILRNVVP